MCGSETNHPLRPIDGREGEDVMHHPNLPKGPLLATKWAKNKVFVHVGGLWQ